VENKDDTFRGKGHKEGLHSEETKEVKDIILSFLKTKKALRMYLPNNPIYVNSLTELYWRFKSFFKTNEDLILKIKQNEIIYEDTIVYSNPEKDDNLALLFFKDGIRELTFKTGLTESEILDFIKTVNLDFEKEILDDDIVTLLWEKDFEHINYVVDEEFLTDDVDVDKISRDLMRKRTTIQGDLSRAYEDAQVEPLNQVQGKIPETTGEVFGLTEEDLKGLQRYFEGDSGENRTIKVIDIIFELLFQEKDYEGFSGVVGSLEGAIEFFLRQGDFRNALILLEKLRDLSRKGDILSERLRGRLRMAVFNAGKETNIKEIGNILNKEDAVFDEDAATHFLKLLDKVSITPLCHLLSGLENIKGRRIVTEALVTLGRGDIKVLLRHLEDPRWYFVRNIIHIIGRIGDKSAIEPLGRILNHEDIRVRREAVRALGMIGGPQARDLLIKALKDSDGSVRTSSARALSVMKDPSAIEALLLEVNKKDFLQRAPSEKKEFFYVLGENGGKQVEEVLIKILKRKSLFRKSRNDEMRALAALSLGIMKSKEAVPYLEKTSESKNRNLKEASEEAIRRIRA
jgi:HEAT repeat protein